MSIQFFVSALALFVDTVVSQVVTRLLLVSISYSSIYFHSIFTAFSLVSDDFCLSPTKSLSRHIQTSSDIAGQQPWRLREAVGGSGDDAAATK